MAEKVLLVSGNENQAVANDDFEAFQRLANQRELKERGLVEEPPPKVEPAKKEEPKPGEPKQKVDGKGVGSLSTREMRELLRKQEAELTEWRAGQRKAEEKKAEERTEEVRTEPEKKAEAKIPRPKVDDKLADGKPKYETWEKYEDALLEWNTEQVLAKVDERNAKKSEEARVEAVNKTIEQSWNERVDKARKAHADFDEVALDSENGPGKLIGPGSIVDKWILDSEYGAELLYHFGKNPEELQKFGKINGTQAFRELTKLEEKLAANGKQKAKASEEGKEEEPEPPRVTKTPKPASEVGGRGNKLPDPVQAAIADGSDDATRRYIDEQNRREIRQKFGDKRA